MIPPNAKRGEPYFDDGNIILVTEETPTLYRLHRGVLARHSEIFHDMFAMPQPNMGALTHDGCQVVTMHDIPIELSNLVKALYDGASFKTRNIYDFFYLAGILRLATKYFINHLRQQAITHLTLTWTHTLQGHDVMVQTAVDADVIDNLTYPYVHPIHALNLARETHVHIVMPSILYFLSLYSFEDVVRSDHPKLKIEHPSRPSSDLSREDISNYIIMFQSRIADMLHFIRTICGERSLSERCKSRERCHKGFSNLSSRLSRNWHLRTAMIHYVLQVCRDVKIRTTEFCEPCSMDFERDCTNFREELWNALPTLFGMTWEQLRASDLPPSSSS